MILLGGCLSSEDNNAAGSGENNPSPPANSAPTISGNPALAVIYGDNYSFTPTASDPDGDPLVFSVENLPSWAAFDAATGKISGTPTLGNVGIYADIVLSVSDGALSDTLPAFSIDVTQAALGSVTLQWAAPTQNTDGTALTDLSGYKIYFGKAPGSYPNEIDVNSAGTTTYVIENLVPDTYYFVSTAYNSQGVESGYSNMATMVVSAN